MLDLQRMAEEKYPMKTKREYNQATTDPYVPYFEYANKIDDQRQSFIAGATAILPLSQPVESKWISVEDWLPKQATFVIAHKKNGMVLGLYYNADKEFMYGKEPQTRQITHWQPLPLPPNK